jgi:glycosyltransferase involved in cell wall biosynthesis
MNILQVVPFFTPNRGGSVTIPYQLAKGLSKKGHNVTIITTDFEFDKNYAASLETIGVKIVPVKCVANLGLFLYSPAIKVWLETNLKNFEVVHMHNFRAYQNNVIHEYAVKFRIPYLVQPHGSLPKNNEKNLMKELYDFFWGRKIINDASKVIAVSDLEVKQFLEFGIDPSKIMTIPNGLEIERFSNSSPAGTFREKNGIKEKHLVLYLGRLHKGKGIEFLMNAFSDLIKDRQDVALAIVGPDYGFKNALKTLARTLGIEKNVYFIEFLSNVAQAYRDADLTVYPAHYEISGLVAIESLFCETPVIITEGCGLKELINELKCGYVVKYGDIKALKEDISYILDNPLESKMAAIRGKNYILSNLTSDKILTNFEKVYEDCICST